MGGIVDGHPDDADDTARIPDQPNCPFISTTVTIGSLSLGPDAEVFVESQQKDPAHLTVTNSGIHGGKVTLSGTPEFSTIFVGINATVTLDGAAKHTIDGEIFMIANSSVLEIEGDHALIGNGLMLGTNEQATVRINPGSKLTNGILITQFLQIVGDYGAGQRPGAFHNDGVIVANALTLRIDVDATTLTDTPGLRWRADGGSVSQAVLQFVQPNASLVGDFEVLNCLTIQFLSSVTTSGNLVTHEGAIDATSPFACFCYEDPLSQQQLTCICTYSAPGCK